MFLEENYILEVSPRLEQFKRAGSGYMFRCPYCGDSSKNKFKTRGNFYFYNGTYLFKCFNCDESGNVATFLRDHDSDLYKKYMFEKFKYENSGVQSFINSNSENVFKTNKENANPLNAFIPCADLPDSHSINKYLIGRKIPRRERFMYTPDASAFLTEYTENESNDTDPKLVIPLYSENNTPFGAQFRSLDKYSRLRYQTCIFDKRFIKSFGMNDIDRSKRIFVFEGSLDAAMVKNSIASLDAALHTVAAKLKLDREKDVLIFDNEPRNKFVVRNMERAIDDGWKVLFYPKTIEEKDINQMIVKGKKIDFITKNIFSKERAKLMLTSWKS